MKPRMVRWLFPVVLLGTVMFVTVDAPYKVVIGGVLAVLLVPVLWRVHSRPSDEADTRYWRVARR
jgi:hypothetical protein